jgi:predicted DNA-binding protein
MPVRLANETDARLASLASRSGLSKAELIRLAVDAYMEQVEETGEIVQRISIREEGRTGDNFFSSGGAAPARTEARYEKPKKKRAAKRKGAE